MMAIKQPIDAAARARALSPEHSFICVAPAGSGKTELLTQRMLVLLAKVQKPEEILAITFTRKAAAEMQHRVLSALRMALGAEPQEAHKQQTWALAKAALAADKTHHWQLLNNPHRLQIRTFDGLCASLVKALPLQAQMGAGVGLSDDPERLFTLAAKSLLAELESPEPAADALATLLAHLDNNQQLLRQLFVALLHTRAAWLPVMMGQLGDVRSALEGCLQQVRDAHLEALAHTIPDEYAVKLCALADFAARHLPVGSHSTIQACHGLTDLPGCDEHGLCIWQGLQALLQTSSGGWRKRLTKNEGLPTAAEGVTAKELKAIKADLQVVINALAQVDGLQTQLSDVPSLPYVTYPEQQWQVLQALTALLPRLVAHLQWVFAREGELDFTEMSVRAEQALGSDEHPTDLALRLDYRHHHLLVDEFQDTSSQQMQLIQRLTSGWQAGDGRTLFCVGDAMQSIYAFRSANVGLFLRCLQGRLGDITLEPITLQTNFRSQARVVEWVNSAFSQAFPAQTDVNLGAVTFGHAVPFNDGSVEPVTVQAFTSEDANALGHAEGEWIRAQIQTLLQDNPETTIAILGRGRKELSRVLPSLRTAGLSYRAVDLDPLASLPAVQDIWALTRALLDPTDTVAWLSVLRAPWCGATLEQLTALRALPGEVIQQLSTYLQNTVISSEEMSSLQEMPYQQEAPHQKEAPRQEKSQKASPAMVRACQILQQSLSERDRRPLVDWVKGTWLALGGSFTIQAGDRLSVERYFEALAELQTLELQRNPERLTRMLESLYALPDPESDGQIQVMTMHKSKGLEFDAVFLVGLGAAGGKVDSPLMRWHEPIFADQLQPNGLLLSPMGERGEDHDALYQWLGLQQKRRENLEACRLLYVACTRAKQRLYLSAELLSDKNHEPTGPRKSSLLSHIWAAVSDAFIVRCYRCDNIIPIDRSSEQSAAEKTPLLLHRLPQAWQPPASDKANGNEWEENINEAAMVNNVATAESLLALDVPSLDPPGLNLFDQENSANVGQADARSSAIGTLVHEVLELAVPVYCKTLLPKQLPLEQLQNAWRQRLSDLGVQNNDLNAALLHVNDCIQKTLAPESPLMVALTGVDKLYPEFALEGVTTAEPSVEELSAVRLDLWWRSPNGEVFLLDYKTTEYKSATDCKENGQGNESVAAFDLSQKAHYKPTLNYYAKLLEQYLQEPVTPILYLLSTQSWLAL